MEKQPLTLNAFQSQTIENPTLTPKSASWNLVNEASRISIAINELANPNAEMTPAGFENLQMCFGNILRDVCILVNSFECTLESVSGKVGKARLPEFAYPSGRKHSKSRKKVDEQVSGWNEFDIATMPEKKKKTKTEKVTGW